MKQGKSRVRYWAWISVSGLLLAPLWSQADVVYRGRGISGNTPRHPRANIRVRILDQAGNAVTWGKIIFENRPAIGASWTIDMDVSRLIAKEGLLYNEPAPPDDDLHTTLYIRLPGGETSSQLVLSNIDYWAAVANSETPYAISTILRLGDSRVSAAPIAKRRDAVVPADQPRKVTLVATDLDGNNARPDRLIYYVDRAPSHGTLSSYSGRMTQNMGPFDSTDPAYLLCPCRSITPGASTGTIYTAELEYRPARGFKGSDSFAYRVSDGMSQSAAPVHVTVTPHRNSRNSARDDN